MNIVNFPNSHAQQVVVDNATLDFSKALVDNASLLSALAVFVCIAYY